MKKLIILFVIFSLIPLYGCTKSANNNIISSSKAIKINVMSHDPNEVVKLFIDGKEIGTLPLTHSITYGKHKFSFRAKFIASTKEINIDKDTESILFNTYTTTIAVTSSGNGPFNINIEGTDSYYNIGYTVYLDGKFTGKTLPVTLNVSKGNHRITLVGLGDNEEYSVNVKGDTFLNLRAFYIKTNETVAIKDFRTTDINPSPYSVIFDGKPVIDVCCSPAAIAYSGVFVGDKITVSGITTHKEFYIQYPSGKCIKINTKPYKGNWKRFSKEVLFNEMGQYKMLDENKKGFDGFDVLYKVILLPPTKAVSDLFGTQCSPRMSDAVAIKAGADNIVKLLITDANGTPAINKPIGAYNAKTDGRGIVTLDAKGVEDAYSIGEFTVGENRGSGIFYGDLLAGVYNYLTLNKEGYVVSTSMYYLKSQKNAKFDIKYEGDDVYLPSEAINGFNLKNCKTKTFNGKLYVAVNTIVPTPDTTVIITDKTIEFYKLKCFMP